MVISVVAQRAREKRRKQVGRIKAANKAVCESNILRPQKKVTGIQRAPKRTDQLRAVPGPGPSQFSATPNSQQMKIGLENRSFPW